MTQVNPTIKYYAYLNGSWTELNWASNTVKVKQGIMSNDPTVRIASVGQLDFTLNNANNIYTPGHASALTGWKNGVKIKQVITYDGNDYPSIWHVEPRAGIQIDPKDYGTRKATVTAVDWLDYALKQPVGSATIETDVTADDVIALLLGDMPIEPENTSLDTGVNTFSTALDTVDENSTVYGELAKLALSEWGYIYLRPDTTDGETLHFDNFYKRNGLVEETIYDTDQVFDDDVIPFDAEIKNGKNLINSIKVYAYPRKIDSSTVTLFELSEPLQIASGQSITLRGTYANPDGGAKANGKDMVTPVATTDYLANTKSDGTGTNKTSDITVSASYGSNSFAHVITNGASQNVWITKFNCRGKGIYVDNAINYIAENNESILDVGTVQRYVYQKYQKSLDFGTQVSESELFFEKDPENRINSISFYANRSDAAMQAFLNLGIGDMIRVESDKGGIDAYHFIQGVQYRILAGNIIWVKWTVRQALNLALGLSLLGCSLNSVGSTDMIDYGVLPQVTDLEEITLSTWIYSTHVGAIQSIFDNFSDATGYSFYVGADGRIMLTQVFSTGTDSWRTTNVVISEDAWYHVVLTRDNSDSSNAPHIYIDGVDQALQKLSGTGGGTLVSETGNHFMIGNSKSGSVDYANPFYGYIMGPRVYDAIKNQAAVTALYNAGRTDTDTQTDDLVWQGGCFKTSDESIYDGTQILDNDHRPIDNIYHATGLANGRPIPFDPSSPPSNQVKSLLHFNGADESTTFTDETGRVWTATGNAQIDTAIKKFGTGGGLFDGASGSYITTPDHPSFILGNNDWTFDFWVRFSDVSSPTYPNIFAQQEDVNNRFLIFYYSTSNKLICHQKESGSYVWQFSCSWTPTVNTWYHVAIERNGNSPLIFIDGTSQAVTESTAISGKTAADLDGDIEIGALGGTQMIKASIDEFRFTNGTARWTANFTPPTSEYTY